MNKIAIIPARSGSKGLNDKNIIDICGKPLIAYSIEAALSSGLFEKVILSTDSDKYAQIGKSFGSDIMMRDEKLSDDKATTFMVIEDILYRLKNPCDYFVLLQPTSPLRTEKHIKEAVEQFEKHYSDFDFLVSVKEAEHANVLVKPIEDDLSLKHFDTDFSNYRRQGYKDYSPNGAIFIAKPQQYLNQKHFFGIKSIAYKMNKFDSVDIDDELDYKFACLLMGEKKND